MVGTHGRNLSVVCREGTRRCPPRGLCPPSPLPARRSAQGAAPAPRRRGAGEVPLLSHLRAPHSAHGEPPAVWGVPRCRVPRAGRGLPAEPGLEARGGPGTAGVCIDPETSTAAGGRIGGGGSGGGSDTGRPSGPRSRYRAQQRPPSHAVPGPRQPGPPAAALRAPRAEPGGSGRAATAARAPERAGGRGRSHDGRGGRAGV